MSILHETIWAGYNILFEANAGDALHRGVNFLAGEYNIPRDQARTMCQAVRRACFDIFSEDASLADKTKDPKVKAVIGLFVPVLKFLCERFGIHDGNPASMRIGSLSLPLSFRRSESSRRLRTPLILPKE